MEMPAADVVPPDDFATTWRRVVQDPAGFFSTMPESGGLGEPLRFLGVCAAIDAAGTFFVTWSPFGAIGAGIGLVAGTIVLASILTLVTQHLFDGRAGFEPVFRAVAWGSAPAVAFWIPRLGAFACLYAWFLHVRGIERVQNLEAGRATLATTVGWVGVWLLVQGMAGAPLGWIGTR